MKPRSKSRFKVLLGVLALTVLTSPAGGWAQDDKSTDKKQDKKKEKPEAIANEVTIGAHYLGDDAYRFGKYSGLSRCSISCCKSAPNGTAATPCGGACRAGAWDWIRAAWNSVTTTRARRNSASTTARCRTTGSAME